MLSKIKQVNRKAKHERTRKKRREHLKQLNRARKLYESENSRQHYKRDRSILEAVDEA